MAGEAGRSGLIIRVPEAEALVGGWREQFDPGAADGVPAHVTVLYPFLPEERLDAGVHAAAVGLFGEHPAFDLRFERCGRFGEVLYLVPGPDKPLRRLTDAVASRWPEAPPYGGLFEDVVPHLTVAQGQAPDVMGRIEAALAGGLPVMTRAESVDLMVYDGSRWRHRASYALGG